ncbi:4-hydroxybenzoate polyprenyltransferase [uncultured Prochlorococcus sp.]|uniref:4-hydroxybenzoate polyprenyltransferase n=1 Tax=uncultured Prochlorococcus sp. TaxID=159733 RepID=UPI002590AAE9|nr:4-hydroxybenzoate polyprenyltransferase [uncultured Prochlorococcus sp.]
MKYTIVSMRNKNWEIKLKTFFELLRWNKPTGRIILLIPAGWSLYLTPDDNPTFLMFLRIIIGGLLVSGLGCVVNDIWDKKIDQKVVRTKNRPLAANKINLKTAYTILILLIICSFFLTLSIPEPGRVLSISLAFIALPIILIYPSAKRWFKYPQLILSICWGFAVLIPWAANEGNLNSIVLLFCWLATIFWTFGFDTVYALADKKYDINIGINSSAINLQKNTRITIQICYFLTSIFLALCGVINQMDFIFWPIWLIVSILMQRDILKVFPENKQSIKNISNHFKNQSIYGGAILLGIIVSS